MIVISSIDYNEFIRRLNLKNNNLIIYESDYHGWLIKTECHCLKCNHSYKTTPRQAATISMCPKCSAKNVASLKAELAKKNFEQIVNSKKNDNIEILGEYINAKTKIKCKCKICGYQFLRTPDHILGKQGCPVCSSCKIIAGVNDFPTVRPDLLIYIVDKNSVVGISPSSKKKVLCRCPDCKKEKKQILGNLYYSGFACPYCSDNISYPNKFCRAVLTQLNVKNLKVEWCPDWMKESGHNYFYDNYFEDDKGVKYVLEADGEFHYRQPYDKARSLNENIRIDEYKDNMAEIHGINVIRIDCRKSNMNYIKENIINSMLNSIFDLALIDWDLCNQTALNNLIKDICDYYMSQEDRNKTVTHTSKKFNYIGHETVRRYLKIGANLGWCDYDPVKALSYSHTHNKNNAKLYNIYDSNKTLLATCLGMPECSKYIFENYGINILPGTLKASLYRKSFVKIF